MTRLAGFWALLGGGVLVAVLTVALQPVVSQQDCSNYGASGNASAFADPAWDLRFPLVLLGWVALVVLEQALPFTWRRRRPAEVAGRAAAAVLAATTVGCCLGLTLGTVCR
ncbi:hypothetical protein BJ973_004323 [Actinoplanes tereljensis]|uniref:Uncharacterized protein n=1 Tax=Paractinoplanes tereljensis TaxID=571912 RepID=A0A919NUG1_9ACTN|nr:hypothetical protein [Actinoplanes tereljensis]GIF23712.1 hypothetical protein Ate02nite_64420 [Actinoplanes tereljensis]